MEPDIAIFAITEKGRDLARRLVPVLGARLYLHHTLGGGGVLFRDLKEVVEEAFGRYRGLVFVMATGIVVRTIAPLLKGKEVDPAVVVMDEGGRFVVSLLSGHLGGANSLAERIGGITGASPVVTTATDINGLPSIEAVASVAGCRIENVERIKAVNRAILKGEGLTIAGDDGARLERIRRFLSSYGVGRGWRICRIDGGGPGPFQVVMTERSLHGLPGEALLLRPRSVVLGVGCERGIATSELEVAFEAVLGRWGLSPLSVVRLATIDVKRDEEGLIEFARTHGMDIDLYPKEVLAGLPLPSGPSDRVMERMGIGGVCEPAAMASAGTREVLFRKEKIGRITFAAARIPFRGP